MVNLSSRSERDIASPCTFWRKLTCGVVGQAVWTTGQREEEASSSRSSNVEILSQYNRRNAVETQDADIASLKVSRNVPTAQAKKHSCEPNRGTLQWLVWGLNCVVAHYSCSSHSTATQGSILKGFAGLPAQHHAGKPLGIWEMLSHSFTQMPPWRVNFADVHIYGGDGELLDPLEHSASLTGCIVGLGKRCTHSSVGVEECIGVGMIRALNTRSQVLYVIAPLSPAQLETVDCLTVRDVQNTPLDLFKSTAGFGFVSTSAYVCSNGLATEGSGARAIRSRNNILRKP